MAISRTQQRNGIHTNVTTLNKQYQGFRSGIIQNPGIITHVECIIKL